MRKILINNFLIILTFFIIIEIFLRAFNLADLRGHEEKLLQGEKNIEAVSFGKKVFIDKYGYRVPNKKFKYKDSDKTLIFVGDSVLFASGVDEDKTISGKIRNSKKNLRLINASFLGNNLSDIISDIKKNHSLFLKSEFYFFLTLDDLDNYKKNKNDKENPNKIDILKDNIYFSKINQFLRAKSYTYMWIKGVLTKPSERYFLWTLNLYNDYKKVNFLDNSIGELKMFINSNKIKLTIVIIPYEFQTRDDCKLELFSPQMTIKEILDKNKLQYIDFSKIFCNFSEPKKLYLNFDPVHLSIRGHNLIFETLNERIN